MRLRNLSGPIFGILPGRGLLFFFAHGSPPWWNVDAGRVGCGVIAGQCIRSGSGSTAYAVVFTDAALAVPIIRITKGFERRRVRIDFLEWCCLYIAAVKRQETIGVDIADMVDEGKT